MEASEKAHRLVFKFLKKGMTHDKAKELAKMLCYEVVCEIDIHHVKIYETLERKAYWEKVSQEVDNI
jgi:hypothetical protein